MSRLAQTLAIPLARDACSSSILNWKVSDLRNISYNIRCVDDIFSNGNDQLKRIVSKNSKSSRQIIIVDQNVNEIYGNSIVDYFHSNEMNITLYCVNSYEEVKKVETILDIVREFERFGLLRRDNPVLAIGGGVLLDIVGFAASIYRRGVPYIRIPTNLMALVDASIGIKTGINFNGMRNRLGTYYAPQDVLLDRSFLKTVSRRELSNGMGEILKLAVIKDAVPSLGGARQNAHRHCLSGQRGRSAGY